MLETQIKSSELFPYQHKHFYLFTKSGFTKGCKERPKEMENVVLVKYEEIMVAIKSIAKV